MKALARWDRICREKTPLSKRRRWKSTEGTGDALNVELDDGVCSSPTAARSKELQAKTVRENSERGLQVLDSSMGE